MCTRGHRALVLAVLCAGAMLLVAACGGSGAPSSARTTAAAGKPSSTPASGASRPTLLVYSAQGYDHNTVAAFQKATGIPTRLVDDSTGPLLARIQAEKADPQWGLLWVDGDEAFAALDRQGLLARNLKVPAENSIGRSLVPADHSYVPTGVTMACTMVYNARAIKTPPSSWQALLSPAYRGKVGMNDPAVSGPTYPCVAGLMNYLGGVAQGEAFLRRLKANGLQVSQTNGDTLHLLQTGQIDIGLIQSSAATGAALTMPGVKVAYLPRVTLLPSCIGIDAHVSKAEQAEAQKFIDFVLSPAGQRQMQTGDPTGDSLYWPLVAGVAPRSGLPPLSSISYQRINPYVWGTQEPAINTWFTDNIAQ